MRTPHLRNATQNTQHLPHPNMYTPLAIISCRALRLIPTSLYTYLLQQSTVYRITSYTKYGRSGTSHTVFCPYISMYHTTARDKGGDLPVIIPAAGVRTPLWLLTAVLQWHTHTHTLSRKRVNRQKVAEFPFQQNRFCLAHNIRSLVCMAHSLKYIFKLFSWRLKLIFTAIAATTALD